MAENHLLSRLHTYKRPLDKFSGEIFDSVAAKIHDAGRDGVEGVVRTAADIIPGVIFTPALADNNLPRPRWLARVNLHAQALTFRLSA